MVNGSSSLGKDFMLGLPVKRRRALVATIPSRNSRPELIANDGQGANLPSRLSLGTGADHREAAPYPVAMTWHTSER